jgi:subtilase family serine protease
LKKFAVLFSVLALLVVLAAGTAVKAFAQQVPAKSAAPHFSRVCPVATAGSASCDAILVTPGSSATSMQIKQNTTPAGYGPADLQSAYNLTSASANAGSGETVAIVDAYNDPNAASDLAVYRSTFGLPPCTVSNGCFKQVNQNGSTSGLPKNNASWSQEISLDLDMVSAICPNCHILLVEANSPSFTNLGTAVNTAVKLGANAVSNSYGGSESSGELSYASYYSHPGVAITASAGDSGYGVEVPAAYNTVTAVGGTTLTRASNTRGWSETVWSGTGSGCSAYVSKPSWQTDPDCSRRTVGDIAADADPNTGVAVYDSYAYQGVSGWLVFGGTSVASPIIASVYALAGNAASLNLNGASYIYSHYSGNVYDVTSGSNGSCGGTYLCTGEVGYDGPTGWGTPDGIGAF